MKLAIHLSKVEGICKKCPSFRKINKRIFDDLLEISCVGDGEQDDFNCEACTSTLNIVGQKYPPAFTLAVADYYTR